MDTSKWANWQYDYQHGLILIMPPPDISAQINPLRAKYDPRSQASCPAHISVSDPLQHKIIPETAKEIRDILSDINPFWLHFNKLHASTEHPGVAYPIEPVEPIFALKEALHRASVFAKQPYGRRDISPHMTIAEFISIEAGLELCAQLQGSAPRGSFLCDRLVYIVPDEAFCFQQRDVFLLGGGENAGISQNPSRTRENKKSQ